MSMKPDSGPPPEVPAWHVLGDQIRSEDTMGATGLIPVHVVPYMIDAGPAKGHQGVAKFTADDYTPEEVQREIEAQVANTHSIADLGKARV